MVTHASLFVAFVDSVAKRLPGVPLAQEFIETHFVGGFDFALPNQRFRGGALHQLAHILIQRLRKQGLRMLARDPHGEFAKTQSFALHLLQHHGRGRERRIAQLLFLPLDTFQVAAAMEMVHQCRGMFHVAQEVSGPFRQGHRLAAPIQPNRSIATLFHHAKNIFRHFEELGAIA